jgi:hypothetical protein
MRTLDSQTKLLLWRCPETGTTLSADPPAVLAISESNPVVSTVSGSTTGRRSAPIQMKRR